MIKTAFSFRLSRLLTLIALAVMAQLALLTPSGMAQNATDDPEGAKAFIQTLSDNAVGVWSDATMTEEERQEAFRQLLHDGFDLDFISKLVLGRHVRTASRDELREYLALFPDYIVNSFARRLGDYGNEKLEVNGTVDASSRDVFVRSRIIRPGGEPIVADWRLRKTEDTFRIVDVKVEGISLAITQRDEFSSIIERQGFDGLLETLRNGAKASIEEAE